jgi:hypothetical protein
MIISAIERTPFRETQSPYCLVTASAASIGFFRCGRDFFASREQLAEKPYSHLLVIITNEW